MAPRPGVIGKIVLSFLSKTEVALTLQRNGGPFGFVTKNMHLANFKEEMMKRIPAILGVALLLLVTSGAAAGLEGVEKRVRHELVMLPYYSVFDNFAFKVDGTVVTLHGQVTRPTLRSAAERVVSGIEGVSEVVNEIEVLPVSPNDDRIRRAVFGAIYRHPALSRYGYQSVPPIHIIVKNGNVTLEGVVNNGGESNIAEVQANGVSGVFSVVNNLIPENRE